MTNLITLVVGGTRHEISGDDFEALWNELGDTFFAAATREPMSPPEALLALEAQDPMAAADLGFGPSVWEVESKYFPTLLLALTDEVVRDRPALQALRGSLTTA